MRVGYGEWVACWDQAWGWSGEWRLSRAGMGASDVGGGGGKIYP